MADTTTLLAGLSFAEGPRWHDDRLVFSDFYRHEVLSATMTGELTVLATVAGQPSGLGWLPDGRMLVVSMVDRRVLRLEPDGSLVEHADLSSLATWHCNDMVVDRFGRAYVGNFGFDLDGFIRDRGVAYAAALQLATQHSLAPFRYTSLLWAILLGMVFFGELPDLWMLVGSAIVIGSGLYTFYRESKRKAALARRADPASPG